MPPRLRELALTAHVTASVGWLGAVAAFLALSVIGLTSQNAGVVRGVFVVMEPAAWLVLVPLAFAALLTGLISSLGTRWGLFRHYWVLFKLVITLAATVILLTYMETFAAMAAVAAEPSVDLDAVRNPSPMVHAVLALLGLLLATVLGVYKPQGMTWYGRRKQLEQAAARVGSSREPPTPTPRWVKVSGAILALILLFLVFMHRHGHGPVGH